MSGGKVGNAGAEYSLRIAWSLARWVEDTLGREALLAYAASASVKPEDFDGTTCWISGEQFETLLQEGRRLAGDDATFRKAVVHRFAEGYGAFRHMIWSLSIPQMSRVSVAMSNKVITRVGHFEEVSSTRSTFRFTYTSPADTELMCLSRRVVWSETTTLHGLPPGELIEHKCMGRGDDCCEYELRWVDQRTFRMVTTGLVIGLVVGLLARTFEPGYLAPLAFALFGAGVGYAMDLRRITKVCVEKADTAVSELRALGEAEAETRSEIVALQQREHAWTMRMEHEASERDAALEHIVQSLEGLQRSRATSIRGFSHDLRNPLFIVRANSTLLRECVDSAEAGEMLDDIESGAKQMEELLGRLMDVATAETSMNKLSAQSIEIAPLVGVLRRRLRALVYGRGIDVIVEASATAPATISVDRLVFDRVIDNLLTNAAKYTQRGSIRLTLRGGREGLVFELADTGRGIEKSRIAEIFRPRKAVPGVRDPNSYGVGLSSAVRLLGQIGGGIEVTSVVGRGSTFVATFPLRPPTQNPDANIDEDMDGVIANVVTVRSAAPPPSS